MKNLIILIAFTFILGSNSFGQSGIEFSQGTWKELLEKAGKEDKLIFMDAYAEWCGPCKAMSRDVFTDQKVGAFFNAKFVNVKMDMEKGEGVALSKKFGIMAYPTLLFIDEGGEVVHRAVGYHTSDLLLDLAGAAADPEQNIGGIQSKYDGGDRDPEMLYKLAEAKYDAMDGSYAQIADEYLATQPDWGARKNLELIFKLADDIDSKMFGYIMKNRKVFEKEFGEQAVMEKIEQSVASKLYTAQSTADLKEIERFYAQSYPEKAEEKTGQLRMAFYLQNEDWGNFASAATDYYNKFPANDWSELNEFAWVFYQEIEDKTYLKHALGWAKKSVAMDSNYFNNDTLASLYFKLGKKKKAVKTAKKAIGLAKASGEDYSSTEQLIAEIKGK